MRQFVDEVKETVTTYLKLEGDLVTDDDYLDMSSSDSEEITDSENESGSDDEED